MKECVRPVAGVSTVQIEPHLPRKRNHHVDVESLRRQNQKIRPPALTLSGGEERNAPVSKK